MVYLDGILIIQAIGATFFARDLRPGGISLNLTGGERQRFQPAKSMIRL